MRHHGRAEDGARRLRGDDGAAAVEFALILPVLALVVCGVIDLGRWYSAWNETKNAAREGALYAETHPNLQKATGDVACASPNNIEDRVKRELGSTASNGFLVTVTPAAPQCNVPGANVGDTVTVTVTRSLPLITPIMRNLVTVNITANVKATVLG